MKKQVIMKNAWALAKIGAEKFGGSAKDYIAEAMKLVWSAYKQKLAKKGGDIIEVAEWFIKKEFGHLSMVNQINKESALKIKRSTEKANLIVATAYQGGLKVVNEFWAPKSVCF